MTATIRVVGLQLPAIVGVYPHERVREQPVEVDLEFETEIAAAVENDAIEHAVDYDALTQRVTQTVQTLRPVLLESLAAAILDELERTPGVQAPNVRVRKPAALALAAAVEVELAGSAQRPKKEE